MNTQPQFQSSVSSFDGLGIAPKIIEALDRMNFKIPTPIQYKAIPTLNDGKDLIGVAQTGTGKTLAFAVPMLQKLSQTREGKGLVLVPTRELAEQVDMTFQKFKPFLGIRSVVLIGGASMNNQILGLKKHPRVIIATPGRLLDHLEQKTVSLADTKMLVLDEADRMLDMGFAPQIKRVIHYIPKERQTMLFSATMAQDIVRMASVYMKLPAHVEIAPQGTRAERIIQELFVVNREGKAHLLAKVLALYHGSVLLFTRTKIGAAKVTRAVRLMGHNAAEIHSDRSLAQRREALEGFKSGKYRVLVATDIAARGIDVIGIELVINYDLPEDSENYVHRIGRTGRAGHEGRAISFATPEQGKEVRQIEELIRELLPISKHPDIEVAFSQKMAVDQGFIQRNDYRRGQPGRGPRHQSSGRHGKPARHGRQGQSGRPFGSTHRKKHH